MIHIDDYAGKINHIVREDCVSVDDKWSIKRSKCFEVKIPANFKSWNVYYHYGVYKCDALDADKYHLFSGVNIEADTNESKYYIILNDNSRIHIEKNTIIMYVLGLSNANSGKSREYSELVNANRGIDVAIIDFLINNLKLTKSDNGVDLYLSDLKISSISLKR